MLTTTSLVVKQFISLAVKRFISILVKWFTSLAAKQFISILVKWFTSLLVKVARLDFLGGYLPSLSIDYVAMSKGREKDYHNCII